MKALTIAAILLTRAAAFAQTPTIGNTCTVFPANNIWNTPIDTLSVSPNSAAYITSIGATATAHADFGSGTWNGSPIGIPFMLVLGTQTKYPATFTYASESDPGPYAVPLNAPIEGGNDRHTIAIDTDNCILYELYKAYPQAASWQAGGGAIFNLTSNALRPAGWTSTDAAGLPIFPGLVRYDEVAAGEIRHALRFTVPNTLKAYVWPARHYASSITDTHYPPMGQRFRLKASFDISTYPADVQVILRALKKYGMMIADNGSAWYLSGAPDSRWNNSNLSKLGNLPGSAFEAVDVSSLMVDPDSGQAKQPGASVTVTPGAATLQTGAKQQFTAAVQGSTDQSVTWAVNGIAGGSSSLGFVNSTGLYTAPSVPPSGSTVSVQATSVSLPAATGSASVTIKAAAPPVISSLSPNPVTAGAFTLTVNGSGFQSGAVVKLNGAALSTSFVSSTGLTATGSTSQTGSAIPVTVTNPDGQVSAAYGISVVAAGGGATSLSIDATAFGDGASTGYSVNTQAFSTRSGNELLLAFVATDATAANITVNSVTGGGLTWALVQRTNTQKGTAEIWRAFAAQPLANVTATANLSQRVVASITVMSFTGVAASGVNGSGAIGATASANARPGAPTASLTTTKNNSWVMGVGNDYDNAIARTPGPNQTLVHQDLSPTGDTYWVQRQNTPTPASGTRVTINDTAPTGDRYNLSIVEILPGS
jgi:hypothetical protein